MLDIHEIFLLVSNMQAHKTGQGKIGKKVFVIHMKK